MSVATTLWEVRQELVQAFHIAIIHGIVATWQRCDSLETIPQEPDFVGGLVLESTPLIYWVLKSILAPSGVSVSMCAVFCHQKPEVAFTSFQKGTCELGDVLFAYAHTPKVGLCRRNALLCQAKASAKQPYHIHISEKNQLCLYSNWPDFEYQRSSNLTGQKRFVTPKAPHAGAQYLLIDDRPPEEPMSGLLGFPGTYPIGCCMPDETLRDHSHLASELFDLFIFRTGRPFEDRKTASQKHDWSHVVWDLLEAGMRNTFNRKISGRYLSPRTAGGTIDMMDGSSFAMTTSLVPLSTATEILGWQKASILYAQESDIPPDNHIKREFGEEPEAGVSVVLIETSEREAEG
jgi:hypothetical protein